MGEFYNLPVDNDEDKVEILLVHNNDNVHKNETKSTHKKSMMQEFFKQKTKLTKCAGKTHFDLGIFKNIIALQQEHKKYNISSIIRRSRIPKKN